MYRPLTRSARALLTLGALALPAAPPAHARRPEAPRTDRPRTRTHRTRTPRIHPPPGFVAYRATMYGNERTRRARRISSRHTASGHPFHAHAHAFAMNGELGHRFQIWTPGRGVTTAVCDDTGADHPDLAYGFFRDLYAGLPSRGGERRSADEAGTMTVWLKRLPARRAKKHHRRR